LRKDTRVITHDPSDSLHPRALRELALAAKPRLLSPPVITEAMHLLGARGYPARLQAMVDQQTFRFEVAPTWAKHASRALASMKRYEEHEPDFADAFLVAWLEHEPRAKIWTFDSDFRTVWRSAKGKTLRLVAAT
jgi:predicted nucleic acid-binding protein